MGPAKLSRSTQRAYTQITVKTAIGAILASALLAGCGGRARESDPSYAGARGDNAGSGGSAPVDVAGATAAGTPGRDAGDGSSGADGSLASILVIDGQHPGAIAVDDTSLYWLNGNQDGYAVERCSKASCTDARELYALPYIGEQLVLTSDAVLTSNAVGGVTSCSKQGCPEGPRVVLSAPVSAGDPQATGAALYAWSTDGAQLAWANATQIRVCPIEQCTLDTSRVLLDVDHGNISALALKGQSLYGVWANELESADSPPHGFVFTIPLANPQGFTNIYESFAIGALTVTQTQLFWVETGTPQADGDLLKPPPTSTWYGGSVLRFTLNRGIPPILLASYEQWFASATIVASESAAYWTVGMSGGGGARLVRSRMDASAGDPTDVASLNTGATLGIALDADYVYWSDLNEGAILKHAK